ncbi:MAG: LapA family protein [Woeseiaceae bacterium]|nr:LapA family protein [Woeseiaceae bacterium]
MLKRIGLLILIVVIVIVMATFTANNTGMVDIDLAFTKVTTSIPLAFTVTFALGWLFGILCLGFFALKLVNERRILRRSLRVTESEVSSLRNLPLSDAD